MALGNTRPLRRQGSPLAILNQAEHIDCHGPSLSVSRKLKIVPSVSVFTLLCFIRFVSGVGFSDWLIPPWIRISLIRWENISAGAFKLEEGPEWREEKSKILFNGWTGNEKNKRDGDSEPSSGSASC
ncbi:hypothetical protein F2Q70_00020795 [Brassica cretica]|uniref:Uncharacterized protein n=1 Tax=Brassica cretica TaxID=69181 RepID=A0A8S9GQI5_BRACR|nr:hypothetical protein F2Q70_00020795 [Brassica cretica]